jgi:hypothetical protein
MTITRRSILRNLGALTAVRSLPVAAGSLLIGCKSTPAPPTAVLAPQMLRVIFEGPWVFSHPANDTTTLLARAEVTNPHIASCGKWLNNALSINGIPQPAPSARWTGTFTPPQATSDYAILKAAFAAAKAVLVPNFTIDDATYSTDFSIRLPMPNKVFLGGGLIDSSIADPNGLLPAGAIPSTDTILHYDQNAGATPFVLTIGGGSSPLPVNASDDLIFRILHNYKTDCTPDSVHIPLAFDHQRMRLIDSSSKHPNLVLKLTDGNFVPNQSPDGIGDPELGLGMSPLPCIPAKATKPAQPEVPAKSGVIPLDTDYASCAGGGMATG